MGYGGPTRVRAFDLRRTAHVWSACRLDLRTRNYAPFEEWFGTDEHYIAYRLTRSQVARLRGFEMLDQTWTLLYSESTPCAGETAGRAWVLRRNHQTGDWFACREPQFDLTLDEGADLSVDGIPGAIVPVFDVQILGGATPYHSVARLEEHHRACARKWRARAASYPSDSHERFLNEQKARVCEDGGTAERIMAWKREWRVPA